MRDQSEDRDLGFQVQFLLVDGVLTLQGSHVGRITTGRVTVPLEHPEVYRAMGGVESLDQPRRVRLFCDAYGLDRRGTLTDTILHRTQAKYDTIKTWGEAGRPGFAEMWSSGQADYALQSKAFLRARRKDFEAAL